MWPQESLRRLEMTEFRTKGKGNDRQVYPIRKKQPFGVPRKLAYEEVMALRQQGKMYVRLAW